MSALPSQSRYIIGTEACERFSFYGMKSILMLYHDGPSADERQLGHLHPSYF